MLLAETIASKVCGHPCWQVRQDKGACLSFEFGQPHLSMAEKRAHPTNMDRRAICIRGEWHLEVYSPWELVRDGRRVTKSESGIKKREAAISGLEGQEITKIRINPYSAETEFLFEAGDRLITTNPFQTSQSPFIPWRLYDPPGNVLAVRDDGRFCYQRADAPPGSEKWYTLKPGK